MKYLFYILAMITLLACNTKKPETNQNYVAKPEDLASLNKRTQAPVSTPTANTGALNPAHGQPNHRCDIAVGAPLNSATTKAATPNAQTVAPQPTVTTNAPIAQNVSSSGEKLNPAHGQPNHRCDIAVGAPLSSKPTQNIAAAAKPQVNVSQAPVTTQVPILNEKGKRLNPAHGQPNHRCDIAVGAPLT
jgi:hypothetical protein